MKRMIIALISIAFSLILFSYYNSLGNNKIKAINGVMELNNWNFAERGTVKLDGQWELYYNKLLTPEEIKNENFDKYLVMPGKLETQLNGNTFGYMTLRLKVHAQDGVVYGLRIPRLLSAYKVWVNGVLQAEAGQVGESYEREKAIYLPTYSYFTAKDGTIDIVIQSSNFRNLFPLINSFEFGLKDQIINYLLLNTGVDLIIIGSLLIIELLFLSLYNKIRENKTFVYFSILCLLIQLRCAFLNERIIVHFFPSMPYELLSKTAALTFYLWIPVYALFLKEQFSSFPRKIVSISLVFGSIFSFICLVTNNTFYDKLSFISEIIFLFIITNILIFLVKAVKRDEKNSFLSIIAFFILVSTALNDIFVNNGVSYNRYAVQIGMFIFAFIETYVLTISYAEYIRKSEKLKLENQRIYEKSIRDSLTNLYNRSYIDRVLDRMMEQYTKDKKKFSVIMLDIDFFKAINDNYGHVFGDKVLIETSKLITESLRTTDYIGRYGGEEFIAILPDTKITSAEEIAERIRVNVEKFVFENGVSVTISGGVYENGSHTKYECIEKADKLLYLAKDKGRNRIEVC